MKNDRAVSLDEGQKLTGRYRMTFLETSAKSNINVEEVFICLAKVYISQKIASSFCCSCCWK